MPKLALAIIVSLLAGLAVGAWVVGDRSAGVPASSPGPEIMDGDVYERLARVETMLVEEREARLALEDTLAMLFEELETRDVDGERGEAEARRERQAAAQQEARRRDRSNWAEDYNARRIARMVEGGFTEDEARGVLEKESAASYEAMRKAWEARRNGESFDPYAAWSDPQRILRESLGDNAYARYLETQGQPTSVEVTQVLTGSPGAQAGLQAGDRIASYNGERIFSLSDLRTLTMQGDPGDAAVIDVLRDGVLMQLTVPAGPIGITGTGARTRGLNWWGG